MYRCQHNQAPRTSVPDGPLFLTSFSASVHAFSQQSPTLRTMLRYRLSTCGRRAFSVAGPTVWNSLPEDLRDPECCADSYRQSLKTFLFRSTSVFSALEVFNVKALCKFAFHVDINIDKKLSTATAWWCREGIRSKLHYAQKRSLRPSLTTDECGTLQSVFSI